MLNPFSNFLTAVEFLYFGEEPSGRDLNLLSSYFIKYILPYPLLKY